MQASASSRWRPREAFAPIPRYLLQPLRLIRDYDRQNFRPDLIAGLTVGVILLPQAIAFSLIAELPPQMGLYAAIVGGIAGALWGSSNQLHNGPTNALSLLVLSTLSAVAATGTDNYLVAAGMLALMAGFLQFVLGVLRLGILVNFVSHSVVVGFSTGAGVLIILRQLGPLLGVSIHGENVVQTLQSLFANLPDADLLTAAVGIATIVLIVLLSRIDRRLPGPLLVMILASLTVFVLGERAASIRTIGPIAGGLPPLAPLPVFDLELLSSLSTGALAVAAIGLVESTSISRTIAAQTRQRLDNNQEFIGQGIANMLSGLFSGYACAGSFSRSSVNFRAGAVTRVSTIVSSAFVLIVILSAGSLGTYLPVAALSGVLMVAAYNLIDRDEIKRILQGAPGDAAIMVVTFLGTMFLELDFAVLAGILLSFILYVLRTSTPRVHMVVPDQTYRHFVYRPQAEACPQLLVVEIQGDLYFGAVNHVEESIMAYTAQYPDHRYLLLRMHQVNQIDFSGIHMLEGLIDNYRRRGGDVYLVRIGFRVARLMVSTGFFDHLGRAHVLDEDKAIDMLFHRVLDPAICIYECPVRVFRECQNLPKRFDDETRDAQLLDQVAATGPVETLAPRALWERMRDNGSHPLVLVDVREPREFRQEHIPGAISVPLSQMLTGLRELPEEMPIVLVCRTGRRSRRALAMLQAAGHEQVAVLEGGMQAWESEGLLAAVDLVAVQ